MRRAWTAVWLAACALPCAAQRNAPVPGPLEPPSCVCGDCVLDGRPLARAADWKAECSAGPTCLCGDCQVQGRALPRDPNWKPDCGAAPACECGDCVLNGQPLPKAANWRASCGPGPTPVPVPGRPPPVPPRPQVPVQGCGANDWCLRGRLGAGPPDQASYRLTERWIQAPPLEGAALAVVARDRFALYAENEAGTGLRAGSDVVTAYHEVLGAAEQGRNIGAIALAANNPGGAGAAEGLGLPGLGNVGLFAGSDANAPGAPLLAIELQGDDALQTLAVKPSGLDAQSGTRKAERLAFSVNGESSVSVTDQAIKIGRFELFVQDGRFMVRSPRGGTRPLQFEEGEDSDEGYPPFATREDACRATNASRPPGPRFASGTGTICVRSNSRKPYFVVAPEGAESWGWNGSNCFTGHPAGRYSVNTDGGYGFAMARVDGDSTHGALGPGGTIKFTLTFCEP